MLPVKHILFPLDFSERCCGAVPFVDAMASRYGAKVTLLSVAPEYPGGFADPGAPVGIDMNGILEELKARLGNALVREFSHLQVDRTVEIGDPARVITDFASSSGVDLIMMPTHGYGPFRSLLLGSVTAKVLHDAECPVWTAAHVEESPVRDHAASRNIMCAVDGTPNSVALMTWASKLTKDAGAALRLVHVVPAAEGRGVDRQFEENIRLEARETIAQLQTEAGVDAPLCVCAGNVAEGVREEARRHGADLVVIGRGVLNLTLGRLRTHAYGIIRHSPCPVISV